MIPCAVFAVPTVVALAIFVRVCFKVDYIVGSDDGVATLTTTVDLGGGRKNENESNNIN